MSATFDSHSGKFSSQIPTVENSYSIYSDAWKFEFDRLSAAEIASVAKNDPRPLWCAEVYPEFQTFRVLELGPADGYNTMELERLGARSITAIEGNIDAFFRCLILKNNFGLRAQFLLGDFTRIFESYSLGADLLYASGVLYHLKNPVEFIHMCSQRYNNLFLWTHFYDVESVLKIENETNCFANNENTVHQFQGEQFTYFKRVYNPDHVMHPGYIGGLNAFANWISRDDLFKVLEMCGYDVLRIVEDPYAPGRMPAVNIYATLKQR